MGFYILPIHQYYVFSSGTDFKPNTYKTRVEAEEAMNDYCMRHGIKLECTEQDKHERKYSGKIGGKSQKALIEFYINRV